MFRFFLGLGITLLLLVGFDAYPDENEKGGSAWSDIKKGTRSIIKGATKGVKKVTQKIDENMAEDDAEDKAEAAHKKEQKKKK